MKTRFDEMRDNAAEFHRQHPEVWTMFVRFAFDRINRGFKHYSARGIWHRIRWETECPDYDKDEHFKLGDHHTPFYARRFMRMYPKFGPQVNEDGDAIEPGFFRTKIQLSKQRAATGEGESTPTDALPNDHDVSSWKTF